MKDNDNSVFVREGVKEDFNSVMDLAILSTKENAVSPPNMKMIADCVWAALTRQMGIAGVIGKVGGPLEGIVLMSIGPLWYSDDLIIEEKAIFVHPEYRSAAGRRAKKLAEFAKKISVELQLPLAIGVLSNQRTAAKIGLYERIFGEPAGVYFLYNARTGLDDPNEVS